VRRLAFDQEAPSRRPAKHAAILPCAPLRDKLELAAATLTRR
jgi:hypothetical protein